MTKKRPRINLAVAVLIALTVIAAGYLILSSRAATVKSADLNNDGTVSIFDLSILLSKWGQAGILAADLNADNTVNVFDLSILLSQWGSSTGNPPTASRFGWELTPTNIGLAPFGLTCASLPELSDDSWPGHTVPAGTTIYRKRLTGWYDLSQGNITIEQSCIQPTPGAVGQGSNALSTWNSNRPLQGPIIIRDSEYDGSLLSDHDKAYTGFFQGVASLYRNYIHHSGSGTGAYGTYEKTGTDVIIENNYVGQLVAYGDPNGSGNHSSAFTVRDFDVSVRSNRQLLVRNNYFNVDNANATGAFFIQPNGEDVWNVTASGNLLIGNGYNLMLEIDTGRFPGMTYHNMRATNNRFISMEYGPALLRGGGEGWTDWSENYMYNVAAPDGKGTVVTKP